MSGYEWRPETLRMWAKGANSFASEIQLLAHADLIELHADALEKLKVMEEALRAIAQYHRDNSEHWAEMDAGLTMSPRDLSILHSGYAKVAEAPLAAIREKP